MGIVDRGQDYAIVRHGVLARIRNTLDSATPTNYLVDSFVFPGTSGSPVLLKPEFVTIQGAKPGIRQAYLLGVVKSFIPYIDVAFSAQTKRPRVTFEENSGLAEVIPGEYIDETIRDIPTPNHSGPP